MADMPASGPGPKARVKNSAQISMSTERRKSNSRLAIWLTGRLWTMLRAAMKESGKATIIAKSVPMKAMTIVCRSLVQTSRCCQDGL